MEALLSDESFTTFFDSLKDNPTIIPDEVIDYYLKTTGFQCPDPRMYEASFVFSLNSIHIQTF